MKILVLGASGYVGGRLVPELLAAGHAVRCLARRPERLRGLPWSDRVEVVAGDVLDATTLPAAFAEVDVVYHLVHAMGAAGDFADADRRAAANVRDAAATAGVRQIVYLGGLGPDGARGARAAGPELSAHLASRHEVGRVLATGPVPVTELRAAVIIGSGSASFEMLRSLVDVLPVMVVPRWVTRTRCQPIAIGDVLRHLSAVLDRDEAKGRVIDIGGPDVVTYAEMMRCYAEVASLPRRVILPVPVLTPRLSSHWINLVTPLPIDLARPLVDSLTTDVVVRPGHGIDDVLPATARPAPPMPLREAIALALTRVRELDVVTTWSTSTGRARPDVAAPPAAPAPGDPEWSGGVLLRDEQQVDVDATASEVFATVCGIGGARGWYAADVLWRLRGVADELIGGVGMRRGRRHPDELRVGDALDCWRVEVLDPPRELLLRAEMRLPGTAWLQWRVEPLPAGGPDRGAGRGVRLQQRALFVPRGLWGRVYWWMMFPFHVVIFRQLCRRLGAAAGRVGAAGQRHGHARGGVPEDEHREVR